MFQDVVPERCADCFLLAGISGAFRFGYYFKPKFLVRLFSNSYRILNNFYEQFLEGAGPGF